MTNSISQNRHDNTQIKFQINLFITKNYMIFLQIKKEESTVSFHLNQNHLPVDN